MRVLFSFKLNPFIIWRKFLSYSQCSVCLAFKKKKRNYFIILGPQETAGNLLVFKLSEVSILSFQVKVHLAAEKKKHVHKVNGTYESVPWSGDAPDDDYLIPYHSFLCDCQTHYDSSSRQPSAGGHGASLFTVSDFLLIWTGVTIDRC